MSKKPTKKATSKKTTRKTPTKARAPTTRKTKPKAIPVDPHLVARIVLQLVVDAKSVDEIRIESRDPDIERGIEAALSQLARATSFDRSAEIGAGIARLKSVWKLAFERGDFTAAISAQTQISKLLALYPKETPETSSSTPGRADDLAEVAAHLVPLKLARDDYPIAGLARLAAQRIRDLEATS